MGRYIKSLKVPHKREGWVGAVKRWSDIRLTIIKNVKKSSQIFKRLYTPI